MSSIHPSEIWWKLDKSSCLKECCFRVKKMWIVILFFSFHASFHLSKSLLSYQPVEDNNSREWWWGSHEIMSTNCFTQCLIQSKYSEVIATIKTVEITFVEQEELQLYYLLILYSLNETKILGQRIIWVIAGEIISSHIKIWDVSGC